jgi:hypothetical protein
MRRHRVKSTSAQVSESSSRVGPLTAGSLGHQLFKGGTVSWNGWLEPGSIRRLHRDDGAHLGVWLALHLSGTLVHMHDPLSLACPVGGPVHRTVIVEAVLPGIMTMPTPGEAGGAEWYAGLVHLAGGAGRRRMRTPAGSKGNFLPSTPRSLAHWPEEMQANELSTAEAQVEALSDLL